jgi:hypothetical protein
MRGWLAAPILDRNGMNWGLLQLSDKYAGEFSAEDQKQFVAFAALVSTHLETLWDLRNSRKQQQQINETTKRRVMNKATESIDKRDKEVEGDWLACSSQYSRGASRDHLLPGSIVRFIRIVNFD